jgi:pimeloyl-ACP methyl ester carboxylesterase
MTFFAHYRQDLAAARRRVAASGSHLAETAAGPVEYVNFGEGPPVLWIHGVVGGSDQGRGMVDAYLGEGFRTIAPSRFGYLRSTLPPEASPEAQADAYAALLDTLGLERVTLVGTSAGSASSFQFALRHPERCRALAVWSMAVPPMAVPSWPARSLLRAYFGSDFAIWATITYRQGIMLRFMGVPETVQRRLTPPERAWLSEAMHSFLPARPRTRGVLNDVDHSNPGMNTVDFERICIPALIIHAVDDPWGPLAGAKGVAGRIPGARFVEIPSGGHLFMRYHETARGEIAAFVLGAAGGCK